ncbi:MAG: hypothetical protein ABIT01_00855 [Thermoanaerobaculia bacterium]
MKHELNEVTVQGPAGPPTIRFTRGGPIFASVSIRICELPRTEVTVTGLGSEAAGIACLRPGDVLRAEGQLSVDHSTGELYVYANAVARMETDGSTLRPVAPSLAEFDRLEALVLPEATPVTPAAS